MTDGPRSADPSSAGDPEPPGGLRGLVRDPVDRLGDHAWVPKAVGLLKVPGALGIAALAQMYQPAFRLYLGLLGLAWTIRWLIHVHLGYLAPPKSAIRALCISEGLIAFAWLTLPWLPVKYYPPEVVVMLVLLLLGCSAVTMLEDDEVRANRLETGSAWVARKLSRLLKNPKGTPWAVVAWLIKRRDSYRFGNLMRVTIGGIGIALFAAIISLAAAAAVRHPAGHPTQTMGIPDLVATSFITLAPPEPPTHHRRPAAAATPKPVPTSVPKVATPTPDPTPVVPVTPKPGCASASTVDPSGSPSSVVPTPPNSDTPPTPVATVSSSTPPPPTPFPSGSMTSEVSPSGTTAADSSTADPPPDESPDTSASSLSPSISPDPGPRCAD